MASLIWQTISGLMNFSTKPPDKSSSVEFFTESHSDHELDKSVHGSHVNSERSHFGCIYFASQTGTSSRLAAKLKQLIEYQCDTIKYKIIDLSSVQSVSNLCNGVSIFIVSTYGIGQPPDSARHFFNSLSVSTTAALNSNVQYAIFGVGDSQYRCYNASSKYLSKHFARISQWSEMVPLTLGDSSHSIVSDFYNWTAILWPAIRRNTHIESLSLDTFQFDERPLYRLSISRHVSTKPYTTNFSSRIHTTQSVQQKGPFTENNPYYALVHSKAQLFSSDRRCWAIEFDLEESPLRYNTGDHVGIYVRNCSSNIERLQNQLGLAGNDALTNHPHDDLSQKPPLPTHCSVREALAKFLDVNGPVNICLLSQIFNSKAGSNDIYSQPNFHQYNGIAFQDKERFSQYAFDQHLNISDILEMFKTSNIEFDKILTNMEPLRPRLYAISSSSEVHPRMVHITITEKSLLSGRLGVASSYFRDLSVNDRVPIFIRQSDFRLPKIYSTPIIMVGCGSGIAPFRAFIQKYTKLIDDGVKIGYLRLYRGCRSSDELCYADEFLSTSWLTVRTALSRENCQYVMDLLNSDKYEIWNMIKKKRANVYVSGDAKSMAIDVFNTFINIACDQGNMAKCDAVAYFQNLIKCCRYQEDVWS